MKTFLLCVLVGNAAAFGTSPAFTTKRTFLTVLNYYPDSKFGRAVKCADEYGLCELDELEELANDLDEYHSCFFEEDEELCKKEISDRKDVAECLRLQGELRLRVDYLENANLFYDDVINDQHEKEREAYVDYLQAYQSW